MRNFVVLSKIPEISWNTSLIWEQNINKCQHLYMEITWWTRHNYFIGFFKSLVIWVLLKMEAN